MEINLFKTHALLNDGLDKVSWRMRESLIFATLMFQDFVFEVLSSNNFGIDNKTYQ